MSDPVHVRLELRCEGEAFWGRAVSDEQSREFHGWIGLIGAIEALCPATVKSTTEEEQATT
jgi:hypothetical protein